MAVTRLLIADDHAVLRAGLRALVDSQRDLQVVAEAASGDELLRKASAARPRVVTLDVAMPGPPTGRLIKMLRSALPEARVLVLTMHSDPTFMEVLSAAGADGYATKEDDVEVILRAIRVLAAGGRWFPHLDEAAAGAPRSGRAPATPEVLTPREVQVVGMIAGGYRFVEIARELNIGINSVGTYRQRAARKLGVKSRGDLVRAVLEAGWVIPRAKSVT